MTTYETTSALPASRAGGTPPATHRYSIVIPVYGNEGSIPRLLDRLGDLGSRLDGPLEVVLVVDGSPDGSLAQLRRLLPTRPFASQLVAHSRNYGAFAAIRTGLERAGGSIVGVMAADLQEPPELMLEFFGILARDEADLAVGTRRTRDDPARSIAASRMFWSMYRRLVQPEMPPGGVDVFACTAAFRDHLVALGEAHSSLVGLAIWLGFRRVEVPYDRVSRDDGVSGWTLRKKAKYFSDSIFSFTDLPIRLLLGLGVVGVVGSILLAAAVAIARMTGAIDVPGYAATIMVITFFAALNLSGLGIVGAYVWRAFENTKRRPAAVVMSDQHWPGSDE